MFDDENDQYGFWTDEPTRPLERIAALRRPAGAAPTQPTRRPRPVNPQVGTRSHGDTQQLPVVAAADATDGSSRPSFALVDPLLRRVGALAVVIALFIPVAMALRGGDERAALAPEATPLTVAATATAAPAIGAATDSTIDIEALPPATPVNDVGSAAAEQSSAPASEAAPSSPANGGSDNAATPSAQQPAAAEAATPAAACKKYTVVAGDYWILIAKKVSVSVADLLAANKATVKTALYPGGVICLPANASAPTTAAPTTTVKPTTTTAKVTTTTVKVTTTAKATPPAVKKTYTRAEVEAIIRYVWPDELENEAVRIATRESNLQPGVRNFCCFGLFQLYYNVHKGWMAPMGVTNAEQLYDPMVNAYIAYALYLRAGGWGPWKL